MITTLCLNPSFDKTVYINRLIPGRVNRIRFAETGIGGKGINAARILLNLGIQAQCLGFLGHENRERFTSLLQEVQLPFEWVEMEGNTRVNTKVVEDESGRITELNEPGPMVSAVKQREFLNLLVQKAAGSEYCLMSGRLPPGIPEDYYRNCMAAVCGMRCVIDACGAELVNTLEMRPFLIKPNLHELEEIDGKKLSGQTAIQEAAIRLMERGAQNVLVSLGGDGALLITQKDSFFAPAVPVAVKNTVGAGDTLLGGFVASLAQGKNMDEALRCAAAAATAAVMLQGTAIPGREECEAILERVRVIKL